MAGQGRRKRRASSDMDESNDEEDRLEQLLSNHQQRNVSNWGQGDEGSSRATTNRNARRDDRRDMQRKRRRDEDERDIDESFEVDTVGTGVKSVVKESTLPASSSSLSVNRVDGLLLPGHVDVQTQEEEMLAQSNLAQEILDEKEDEAANGELGDFIRLDGDRPGPAARYYEIEEEENRKAFEECPTCGEKGHDKKSCPHLQCLACGALDEHPTRECPMSVSCFRCGGQGHKAFDCKKPRTQGPQGWKECQRCGSTSHVDPKCPTLWRIYYYHSEANFEDERFQKYKESGSASAAKGGSGGFQYRSESEDEEEGEIASQEKPPTNWDPAVRWCYNCAAKGNHWGDECPLPRCNPTRHIGDPSGFSEYMASSGPFAHSLPPPPAPDQHAYRSGLRRSRDEYDRFEAGPGASMHVYDPQREAMHNVDQLFDRHGPGASRRRDAIRRGGGDLASRIAAAPRVDRRSGEGSKAQRYQEMAQERDRWSSADYHRRDGRSSQVSASGKGPAIAAETSSDPYLSEESLDFELTHVVPGKKAKSESLNKTGRGGPTKLQKREENKKISEIHLRKKHGLPAEATKKELRAAINLKKEEMKIAEQERLKQRKEKKKAKTANREKTKVAFNEAQAKRLANGKIEEHDRKAKEFALIEKSWRKSK